MINYWVNAAGAFGIEQLIAQRAPAFGSRLRVCTYESLTPELEVTRGAHLFTAIDRLTPHGREVITALIDRLGASCPGDPVLNDPRRVLSRYDLLGTMHHAGINRFRAWRAGDSLERAQFPVFVREESGHDGALTGLLHDPTEVASAIRSLVVRGFEPANLLVVEFCDLSDAEGKYHMAAAFRVGERIIPAFLIRGNRWVLKWDDSDKDAGAMGELLEYVEGNPHQAWIRRVFDLAGVEYGRLDYGVRGTALQVWEINNGPTPGPGAGPVPPPLAPEPEALWARARMFYARAFVAACEALDPAQRQDKVGIELPAGPMTEMHAELSRIRLRQSTLGWLRNVYGHPTLGRPLRALYSWLVPRR